MSPAINFPPPEPDQDEFAAMRRCWSRQDLKRYLQRWRHSRVAEVPGSFWTYSWRACDIGCGLGRFSMERSGTHPNRAYLGIDKGYRRGGTMVQRFAATERPNLFGLHGNVIPILAGMPESGLDLITIFYPNPWWPRKHRKKRWSYHPLLPKLTRLLKPDGTLLLTSNEGFYLSQWIYALQHHPGIAGMVMEYAGPVRESLGRTHFETKFLKQGTALGEVRFRKAPS